MKKIIIKESQLNELFSSDYIYPIKKTKSDEFNKIKFYEYQFKTKDDVTYIVPLTIKENGIGKIDFATRDSKDDYYLNSIELLKTKDAIKSLNTIKSIIEYHPEIKILVMSSSEDRIKFYKKILDHLRIKYEEKNSQTLIAYLKNENIT